MTSRRTLMVLGLAWMTALWVFGQDLDPEGTFDRALRRQQEAHVSLSKFRGVTPHSESQADLGRMQKQLQRAGAGTVFLLYSLEDDGLTVCLLEADGKPFVGRSHPGPGAIPMWIEAWRHRMGIQAAVRSRAPRLRSAKAGPLPPPPPELDHLADLEAALFPEPVAQRLARASKILILPAGPLGELPFYAMHLPGHAEPLVTMHTLVLLPSLEPLIRRNEATLSWVPPMPGESWLIAGNPDLSGDTDYDFPDLPGAKAEAQALASRVGQPALLGRAATLQSVRDRMPSAEYLVFATHGIADPEHPLEGGFLAFSGGRLTAREIQHMQLRASLAVLSACQTGLGRAMEGGVAGLGRAFVLAGVPAVVVSLWSVDDLATRYFMDHFYQALGNVAPQEALRQAILDTRSRYPHPSQWAAFQIMGEPMRSPAPTKPASPKTP